LSSDDASRHAALAGVRIVLTRAPEQSRELAARLTRMGATVVLLPAVRFADPADTAPLDRAIRSVSEFDWLLFTSANAVRFFAQRCARLGFEPRKSPRALHIAAVGPATAAAAAREGFAVERVATEFRGAGLARALGAELRGQRVLLPRSDRAGSELPTALRQAGAEVSEVVAYCTVETGSESIGVLSELRSGTVQAICFFSPSAVHSVLRQLGVRPLRGVAVAAIGPVTAAAIRRAGWCVDMEAPECTAEAFCRVLADYFAAKLSPGAPAR
jgi:uroporphyrinogen III methyltransferase / synthase